MAWSSQIFSYAVRAATSVVWHGGAERREGSSARPLRPRAVSFLCAKAQGMRRSGRKLPIAACTPALEFDQYGTLVLVSTPHQTASQPPARLLAFASEFHLGASRRTAPAGVLVAELKNNGEDDHDLAVRDPRGRIIASTGVVRHGALGRLAGAPAARSLRAGLHARRSRGAGDAQRARRQGEEGGGVMAGSTREAAMIERLWWRAGFGPRPRDLRGKRTHADLVHEFLHPRGTTLDGPEPKRRRPTSTRPTSTGTTCSGGSTAWCAAAIRWSSA